MLFTVWLCGISVRLHGVGCIKESNSFDKSQIYDILNNVLDSALSLKGHQVYRRFNTLTVKQQGAFDKLLILVGKLFSVIG